MCVWISGVSVNGRFLTFDYYSPLCSLICMVWPCSCVRPAINRCHIIFRAFTHFVLPLIATPRLTKCDDEEKWIYIPHARDKNELFNIACILSRICMYMPLPHTHTEDPIIDSWRNTERDSDNSFWMTRSNSDKTKKNKTKTKTVLSNVKSCCVAPQGASNWPRHIAFIHSFTFTTAFCNYRRSVKCAHKKTKKHSYLWMKIFYG